MMKKSHLLGVFALILCINVTKAQLSDPSYNELFKEGSFLLLEENYDLALKNFLDAYKIDSSSANINFNVGFCYLNSSTKKGLAEAHLAKAITDIDKNYRQDDPSEKSAPPLAHFYYARALHINYKFAEAASEYDLFEKNYARDKTTKEDVLYFKNQTDYAKELMAAPVNVKIENLGDSINSEFPDYSPVLSADERTLIYTTRRPFSTGGEKTPEGQFFEDIVISYKGEDGKWSSPKSISLNINTNGHEGSVNLTPDGQTLLAFRDDNGNGNIYFSSWDGKDWSSLQSFGADVNTKHWETHACLSSDNNTLYFVSDRPGGYGGRDIYRSVKLPNGKWSLAVNVGPTINTKYDEEGPFIHPDGVTLIFASKGHKTMGGFDIFFSTIEEDKKFSEPVNMGYPINTPDDDIYFVTSPDGKRGYFSSANDKGYGEKDIYTMFIPNTKEKPLALFKGAILPAEGEKLPDDLVIIVTNKETGEIVGTYKPKENGTFTTILPPNKNYNFSYQSQGTEFYNEDLFVSNDLAYQEIAKEINLEPVALLGKVKVKGKPILLNTIVFNNSKDKKPVSDAKVTLTEKGAADISYTVDDKGRKEGTSLVFGKFYTIVAEHDGKKSAVTSFNTTDENGSRLITQILYIDGAPAKASDLLLNVSVANKKRKVLANTNVVLLGSDGSKYEGMTDGKGIIKNIDLAKDVNYSLLGENNGMSSPKVLFTTMNVKGKKVYNKNLVIDIDPSALTLQDVACGSPVIYKHFFQYNKNDADEAQDWINLIDALITKSKTCNATVKILSSASRVTTKSFTDNRELAKTRADKIEEKIKAAFIAKGGDITKLTITKVSAVRGPAYDGDYQNTEKYGKFQYIKVIAR